MKYNKRLTTNVASSISLAPARQAVNESFGMLQEGIQAYSGEVAKAQQTRMNQTISASRKAVNTAYTSSGDNPTDFNESVNATKEEFMNGLDTDEEKEYYLARFDIIAQPYQAKVAGNYQRYEQKRNIESKRGTIDSSITSFGDNASLFQTKGEGYSDLNMQLNSLYENRNVEDENGNSIYTSKQKKDIEDIHENKGLYGVQAYVSDNLYVDTKSISNLKEEMLSDPAKYMADNEMSSKNFNESIKYIDSSLKAVSHNEDSPEIEKDVETNIALASRYNQFDFSKGTINNPDLDNIQDLVKYRNELKANSSVFTPSVYTKMIAETKNTLYRMAQDDYGEKTERKTHWFTKDEETNAGNTVLPSIDDKIPQEDDRTNSLRANLYEQTVTNLIEAGIDTDSTDQKAILKATQIANKTYTNYMRTQYPNASQYTDEQLLMPSTFQQLETDRKRKVLYPTGVKLPQTTQSTVKENSIFEELGL